ncbi:MAG: pantetheine-phosphate adenylyltransferase [Lactococcus sp.]
MAEKIGLYTGTFDPLTNGHLDIIKRASKQFDKLYIGIFKNDQKNPMFPTEQRKKMISESLSALTGLENVSVIVHESDLTVNVAKKLGVTALVRSIRNATDLEYEKNMWYFNHEMTGVETVILLAKPDLEPISSTRMRELTAFGQDVSQWLPENVAREIAKIRDIHQKNEVK